MGGPKGMILPGALRVESERERQQAEKANKTRRERLKTALYLRLKMRRTIFWKKT